MKPKVKIIGENGNVFNLISRCIQSLKKAGYKKEEVQEFQNEVTSAKSYNEALNIMMEWCDVQ